MRPATKALASACKIPAAALIFIGVPLSNFAQAQDTQFAKVGWWSIGYTASDEFSNCSASARFKDETLFDMTLMQSETANSGNKVWVIYISNPKWGAWIARKKEHKLAITTTRPWQGTFVSTKDNKSLYTLDLSIDFMNSIADSSALTILSENRTPLTTLDMKDSAAAIKAVVNCLREHPPQGKPGPQAKNSTQTETELSGTGFFVAPNLLVTNNHVVRECKTPIQVRYPERSSYKASISGQDNTNDLALLNTDMPSTAVAAFRFAPRLGEGVASYGFPYAGVLSSSGNFTLGNVTSLSGMKDDTRFLQISTPIQPGNSGGPLLDMSGAVIGVVVAQLNAITMMQAGSVPQNVNFAIQAPIVMNFLSVKGVTPKLAASNSGAKTLSTSDTADIAKGFTVQVYCQG
jgi:serine protease Do